MRLPATDFAVALPAWVGPCVADLPAAIPTREDRMRLVHELADRNWREGNGGPFAALVAEVTALGLAQRALGTWDLGAGDLPAHELTVNWRPCVQCYGATLWSGIRTLVIAGSGPELEEITTFDEGPMVEDWAAQFAARGIEVVDGVLREEALEVFRAYRAAIDAGGITVYNARGASE
jgi:hypothetical protein